MIERDYVQRMLKDIARVMALLMGKKTEESLEIINEAYISWLKLDASFIDALADDELIDVLINEKKLNVNHLEFLAELLAKEGELLFIKKDFQKSQNKLKKSLILFDFVDREQQLFSLDRQATVQKIKQQLIAISKNLL